MVRTNRIIRAGAVWVSNENETFAWDDDAEVFCNCITGETYKIVEHPGEDEAIIAKVDGT